MFMYPEEKKVAWVEPTLIGIAYGVIALVAFAYFIWGLAARGEHWKTSCAQPIDDFLLVMALLYLLSAILTIVNMIINFLTIKWKKTVFVGYLVQVLQFVVGVASAGVIVWGSVITFTPGDCTTTHQTLVTNAENYLYGIYALLAVQVIIMGPVLVGMLIIYLARVLNAKK